MLLPLECNVEFAQTYNVVNEIFYFQCLFKYTEGVKNHVQSMYRQFAALKSMIN